MSKGSVLVVDDEETVRDAVGEILNWAGFDVTTAPDGEVAIHLAKDNEYQAAVVDLCMPGISGMETARRLKELDNDLQIIILTGQGTLESAIKAIQQDIFDYQLKPPDMNGITKSVGNAIERRRLVIENRELVRQLQLERNRLQKEVTAAKRALECRLSTAASLVGESDQMASVRQLIAEAAPSDMTVLIRGESGTGKDVVARLIHESSGRVQTGAFIKINAPAIPETLLESELFGHEPGAFTGAEKRKPGRFELAANGTVFLDEIAEMPPALQAKLLQVIEHKQFTRLGGKETIRVDARIVAATNAPLEQMISDGRMRSDLFYRLNEFAIHIAPLRERVEDIPLLVKHFERVYSEQFARSDTSLSPESMACLMRYHWPGNVRELQSVIKRFVFTGREEVVKEAVGDIPIEEEKPKVTVPSHQAFEHLKDIEIQTIMSALVEARWNQRKAANILGIGYSALRRRIAKYGIKDRSIAG